ncbi:hypothetical protein [Beijerinckia sp. L45]|uniref:GCG_CRPN prefix-to-repeats domain-containing protein n=1 Tax=Beijerinckia sp. L45 TaxID=1641855 RepID=UPI001FED66D2|nr:hypothetical protein [Beijerinckia sp. L45]
MRALVLALATGATLFAGAVTANAMPLNVVTGADAAPELILVAGGCGPGAHRGPYGGCRPNGFFRPHFVRQCFVRPTPYGPRRVCR